MFGLKSLLLSSAPEKTTNFVYFDDRRPDRLSQGFILRRGVQEGQSPPENSLPSEAGLGHTCSSQYLNSVLLIFFKVNSIPASNR